MTIGNGDSSAAGLIAPVAQKVPHHTDLHGEHLEDDYFWLREKANPAVAEYLIEENSYVDSVLAHTRTLQETLYNEILSHVEQTDSDPPYLNRGYYYYSRTQEGKQYPTYCRRRGSVDADEEITLDLNSMASGEDFLSIGAYEISDDGNLLAFSTDTSGFRQYTLQVKDLSSGKILSDRIEKTGSVAWAADNRTLFYTVEDHAKRQYRLYKHRLGEDPADDVLIYEEPDEMFRVGVGRSRTGDYLFHYVASFNSSETRYLRADSPDEEWQLIAKRSANHSYQVDHHSDRFYIRTNGTGINYRIVMAPIAAPSPENWHEVTPLNAAVMLEAIYCFQDHLVVYEREDGLPHLRVMPMSGAPAYRVRFPEAAYTVHPTANHTFATSKLRFNYQSMVTPPSTFDLDMNTQTSELIKQTNIPGGFKSTNYEAFRLFASATDGTRVPVSMVRRKGTPSDGTAPLFLYGYGSYGMSMPAHFNTAILPLLDRGFVYAIAHIRGGGEGGKAWHDAGKMMNKMNTFTDFICAAEMLTDERYADKNNIVIEGGSAGGLLMGAVVNLRPTLFRAVISKVPFVDVINTMLDETLPLTVGEFEEWGNPKVKAEYDYMKSYCPYTNLSRKSYPPMLVKTSFNDSQVMYWEPAKYVARLRTLKTDSNPLLLKTNMAGGHGGSSGRYDRIREIALDYAFILDQTGKTEVKPETGDAA